MIQIPTPAIPYPNPGIQHTRCVLALTIIKSCLDVFRPAAEGNRALAAHIDKIHRWIEECSVVTRQKKLSAGAKRDLDNFFSALASFFITEEMDDETRFHRWAALIWTALIFIEDACNTCPEYTAHQKCWRYLRQTVTTLAEKLLQIEAAVDEDGTAMYEAIWEAA